MKLDNIFRYSEAASAHAKEVDSVGSLINWLSVVFFVLIIGLMLYFMIRYRRRSENEKTPHISHNLVLEIAWSVIPLAIILVFFVRGYKTYINVMQPAPYAQSEDIYVTGSMWKWDFEYTNGGAVSSQDSFIAERIKKESYFQINEELFKPGQGTRAAMINPNVFTVPVNTPVRLVVTSKDVLHSFAIPAMRMKRDAVPGQKREFIFTPTKEGVYHYTCNEMCGTDHAFMVGWMNVVSKEEYAKFKESIKPKEGGTPAEIGERLWERNCKSCHAIDPKAPKGIGPNWWNLWGSERTFVDGSKAIADHQYLSDSINDPAKQIVPGYAVPMPAQGLNEVQIKNLIEFIKTLSDKPSEEKSEEAAK